jgi:hypothetical protein
VQPAEAELLAEALRAAVDVLGHGFFRESQTEGRFAVGETLEFAENHGFAATRWERIESGDEDLDPLRGLKRPGNIGLILYDAQPRQISYRLDGRPTAAAEQVQRHVARDPEEKRLGGSDWLPRTRFPNSQVGLLHDIVDVPHGRK